MTTMIDAGAIEETHEGLGGLKLHLRSWPTSGAAKAVLVIQHGFNAHSGQYDWAARAFAQAGYAVYAGDLRGRGKSEGERFYVERFEEYLDDLARVVSVARTRNLGLPIFLLGHSAGGVIASSYAMENPGALAGLICESFAFRVPAPDVALAIIKGVSHLLPHVHVLRLKNEDFSRDPVAVAALNADPLIADEVQPTQTVAEMVRADERLEAGFGRITLPLLIMHGTEDKATRPDGSRMFFDKAGSTDKELKLYEGHYHDLLADIGKEEALADIRAWMDARLAPRP